MKLYQNRTAVLGSTYRDAHHALSHDVFRDDLDRPIIVCSDSHELTISGTLAGTSIQTVYITNVAHRGKNYELARDLLLKRLQANPSGSAVYILNNDGTVTKALW